MIKLKNILVGVLSSFILVTNTLILAVLMIPLGVIKFLLPLKTLRASFTKIIIKIGELHIRLDVLECEPIGPQIDEYDPEPRP